MGSEPSPSLASSSTSLLPHLTLQQVHERAAQTLKEICVSTWSDLIPGESIQLNSSQTLSSGVPTGDGHQCDASVALETITSSDTQNVLDEEEEDGMSKPDTGKPDLGGVNHALCDISTVLRPPRPNGKGYLPFKGDDQLQRRLEMMQSLYSQYIENGDWIKSSEIVVQIFLCKPSRARALRRWARAYIDDRTLPYQQYGLHTKSLIDNEAFKTELCAYLQSVGKYVCSKDIIKYLEDEDVQERYGLQKTISLSTAKEWMSRLQYRWGKGPKGQYVDGHEREDVVKYRQTRFLPSIAEHDASVRTWTNGGPAVPSDRPCAEKPTVYWYQDESIFAANDRRKVYWVASDAKATPQPKGEGPTLMVSDFVSADYGWLHSPDGKESTRVLFRPGKNRDGYFDNSDIIKTTNDAMDILDKHFPNENHVFVFDNAPTHLKRAEDALSARKMSKAPTAPGKPMFGVDAPVRNPETGNPVYGEADGKVVKQRIRMADAQFLDGSPQSLYFPEGHERAGTFKGMEQILVERGYERDVIHKLRAECSKFECPAVPPPNKISCCCRRLLYNQPDFVAVESILETCCKARGFQVIFLPKFHCELNPIEQCWGYAKGKYRELPLAPGRSVEAELEKNVIKSLDSVPLECIRK